jgi:hypothetical protein
MSSRWSFVATVFRCVVGALPRAPQDLLFSVIKADTVVAILSPLNCLVDIDRHPFLVFGKRRVRLLQITELTRFVRRTRYVREQRRVFGRFHSVLLCGEHLTGPFRCGLQYFERSANISGPSRDATKISDHYDTGSTWPSRRGLHHRRRDRWLRVNGIAPRRQCPRPDPVDMLMLSLEAD